jgi:hypothetical protein
VQPSTIRGFSPGWIASRCRPRWCGVPWYATWKKKLAFYGLGLGLLRFRKHASRYLAPAGLERDLRRRLLTTDSLAEFQDIFHSLIII